MTSHEYYTAIQHTFIWLEDLLSELDEDIDCHSTDNLLDITFPNHTKMILNAQEPLQQLWLATAHNGYQFVYQQHQWIERRTNTPLRTILQDSLTAQLERSIALPQDRVPSA